MNWIGQETEVGLTFYAIDCVRAFFTLTYISSSVQHSRQAKSFAQDGYLQADASLDFDIPWKTFQSLSIAYLLAASASKSASLNHKHGKGGTMQRYFGDQNM